MAKDIRGPLELTGRLRRPRPVYRTAFVPEELQRAAKPDWMTWRQWRELRGKPTVRKWIGKWIGGIG